MRQRGGYILLISGWILLVKDLPDINQIIKISNYILEQYSPMLLVFIGCMMLYPSKKKENVKQERDIHRRIKMKTYLIDLDGTMYRGTERIEGASDFIDYLIESGNPFIFLTNNATRTGKQNVEHMESLGFKGIKPEHFFTSAMAAAAYVAKTSNKRRAFMIGEAGLKEALEKNGFTICKDHVDFVFVGLQKDADYSLYSEALAHLLKGAQLIGTNSDRLLAKAGGFNVGNGAVIAMMEYASGQTSPKIGKPYAPILELALDEFNLKKEDVVLLGDNLETDIRLGTDHGVETIFVTSGVHHEEDIERLKIHPNRTIADVRELIVKK